MAITVFGGRHLVVLLLLVAQVANRLVVDCNHHLDQLLDPKSSMAKLLLLAEGQEQNNGESSASTSSMSSNINNNELQNALEFETIPSKNRDQAANNMEHQRSACQLVQVVHLLNHPGCQPKAIASFACSGSCPSYVQISTSKFWQHERSCLCCQQTASQEATFTLDCPALKPPYKKITTYAPVDCMCRSCTDLSKEELRPQELVDALASETNGPMRDQTSGL